MPLVAGPLFFDVTPEFRILTAKGAEDAEDKPQRDDSRTDSLSDVRGAVHVVLALAPGYFGSVPCATR